MMAAFRKSDRSFILRERTNKDADTEATPTNRGANRVAAASWLAKAVRPGEAVRHGGRGSGGAHAAVGPFCGFRRSALVEPAGERHERLSRGSHRDLHP